MTNGGGASATVVQPHPEVDGSSDENKVLVMPSALMWDDPLFPSNGDFVEDATTSKPSPRKRPYLHGTMQPA